MQKEPSTWREVLARVIEDVQEKRRLAKLLGIDVRTIERWTEVGSKPRLQNFRTLIEALPQYRYILVKLIGEEFPDIAERLDVVDVEDTIPDIPSTVYARVLEEYVNATHPLAVWEIRRLILQQVVRQLDTGRSGVATLLAQCVAPIPSYDSRVRTLREHLFQASTTWPTMISNTSIYFLGAESIAGSVVSRCQPITYNDTKQEHFLLSHEAKNITRHTNSLLAYPLQRAGRVAGCLLVFSTQQHFFSDLRFAVIKRYCDLLSLTFRDVDFYALEEIELTTMPEAEIQLLFLSTFNDKVSSILLSAQQQQKTMSRSQAEQIVLHTFLTGVPHDIELPPS